MVTSIFNFDKMIFSPKLLNSCLFYCPPFPHTGFTTPMYGGYPPSTPTDWSFATAAAAASISSQHPRTSPHHRFHPTDSSCSLTANSMVHGSSFLPGPADYSAANNSAGACSFSPHRMVNYHSSAFFADNAAYSAALTAKTGPLNTNFGSGFNVFPGTTGNSGSKLLDSLNITPPSTTHADTTIGGSGSAFGLHSTGLLSHSGCKLYGDLSNRHLDQESGIV